MAMQLSKTLDEVSRNSIWREHCKKETKIQKFSDHFSIPNPQRMTILADKPNAVVPAWVRPGDPAVAAATAKLSSLCNARHTHQLPPEVYALPATSNMEYGFVYAPLRRPSPMFDYKKTKCDVVAYAETYCASCGGQSPFAKAEAAPPPAAKA